MTTKFNIPEIKPRTNLDKLITVRFSSLTFEKKEQFCKKYHVRKNDLIRHLVEHYLKHTSLKYNENGNRNQVN